MSVKPPDCAQWRIRAAVMFVFIAAMYVLPAHAQTNVFSPADLDALLIDSPKSTNQPAPPVSTGTTVKISMVGSREVTMEEGGTLVIPESGGEATYITPMGNGGIAIKEPGQINLTYVTPINSGGLIVRGPDRKSIYIRPSVNGTVRINGPRDNVTRVSPGVDGTVVIWTRSGRTYTVAVPLDNKGTVNKPR